MDILTHTLSGLAVGTVIASFSKKNWKDKSAIVLFSGLGGALPDIDAISMWHRFDGTIGKFFSLQHTGKDIYTEKFWYSHHSFMHSILAAILFALIISIIFWLVSRRNKNMNLLKVLYEKRLLLTGFILGFLIHLLEDMVTPAGAWGGVRLFFPAEVYIGGTGQLWWWNNYTVFLIVCSVLLINTILLFALPGRIKIWKFTTTVFLLGMISAVIHIHSLDYNFNRKGFAECEQKSKEIQREILGEKVYNQVKRLDNAITINF